MRSYFLSCNMFLYIKSCCKTGLHTVPMTHFLRLTVTVPAPSYVHRHFDIFCTLLYVTNQHVALLPSCDFLPSIVFEEERLDITCFTFSSANTKTIIYYLFAWYIFVTLPQASHKPHTFFISFLWISWLSSTMSSHSPVRQHKYYIFWQTFFIPLGYMLTCFSSTACFAQRITCILQDLFFMAKQHFKFTTFFAKRGSRHTVPLLHENHNQRNLVNPPPFFCNTAPC